MIRRRDGLFAYQLAVVVDDAAQDITHVVRGADLLSSTPRQMALQGALGLTTPKYAHLPVAIDANGIKLSEVAGAAAVDARQPARELWRTLQFLKQGPPPDLRTRPGGHGVGLGNRKLAGAAARRPAPDGVSMSAIETRPVHGSELPRAATMGASQA